MSSHLRCFNLHHVRNYASDPERRRRAREEVRASGCKAAPNAARMLGLALVVVVSPLSQQVRANQAATNKPRLNKPRLSWKQRLTDWDICKNSTMVSQYWGFMAYEHVQRVNQMGVLGDIVEVGVWRGGLSCYMARAQIASAAPEQAPSLSRRQWLFDTFQGMPAPGDGDDAKSITMFESIQHEQAALQRGGGALPTRLGMRGRMSAFDNVDNGKWCYGSLEDVQLTMARSGARAESLRFVKGKAEETLVAHAELPQAVALLRLDTDFYASTMAELQELWPRLSPGGWLYVDDYYVWGGAKKAVDDWLAQHRGWTHQAHIMGAFDDLNRTSPTGDPHNKRFQLLKSNPYTEERPFSDAYLSI